MAAQNQYNQFILLGMDISDIEAKTKRYQQLVQQIKSYNAELERQGGVAAPIPSPTTPISERTTYFPPSKQGLRTPVSTLQYEMGGQRYTLKGEYQPGYLRRGVRAISDAEQGMTRYATSAGVGFSAMPVNPSQAFQPDYANKITATTQTIKEQSRAITEVNKQTNAWTASIGSHLQRALEIVPIWMGVRSVYMGVFETLSEGVTKMRELDNALARAAIFGGGINREQLGSQFRQLSRDFGYSIKEIASVREEYVRAEIGTDTAEKNLAATLKTSMILQEDASNIARSAAIIYKNLGNTITGVSSDNEKLELILATLGVAFKDAAGDGQAFLAAIQNAASTGKLVGVTWNQLVALMSVSQRLIQKNATGGQQLSRAFMMMLDRMGEIEKFFQVRPEGSVLDIFLWTLQKINDLPNIESKSEAISRIFGISGRGAGELARALSTNMPQVIASLKELNNMPPSQTLATWNKDAKTLLDTLDKQLDRFRQIKSEVGAGFVGGLLGVKPDDSRKTVEFLKAVNQQLSEMVPTVNALGSALRIPLMFLGGKLLLSGFRAHPIIAGITTAVGAEQFAETKVSQGGNMSLKVQELMKQGRTYQEAKTEAIKQMGGGGAWTSGILHTAFLKAYESSPEWKSNRQKFLAEQETRTSKQTEEIAKDTLDTNIQITERYEDRIKRAETLKLLGYSELEIEKTKLRIAEQIGGHQLEADKFRERVKDLELQRLTEYYNVLQNKIETTFKGLLSGEKGWGDIGTAINDAAVEGYRTSLSKGLTQIFMGTGFGKLFAGAFGSLQDKIEMAHSTVYELIVRGHRDGLSGGGAIGGATSGTAGWTGGIPTTFGGGYTLPGFGAQGWFNQPLSKSGGTQYLNAAPGSGYQSGYGKVVKGKWVPNTSISQGAAIGMAGASALTGYAAYQSANAGGLSKGASAGVGVMMGAGTLALGASMAGFGAASGGIFAAGGAMAGLGAILPIVGIALLIGAILWQTLGAKKSKSTSVDIRTQENQISSRINVTNKNLEIINRNLIALRSDIRTYMLPASAYFAEKRGIEDEFSIMSRRGFQGGV